jgi:hypothetical protein
MDRVLVGLLVLASRAKELFLGSRLWLTASIQWLLAGMSIGGTGDAAWAVLLFALALLSTVFCCESSRLDIERAWLRSRIDTINELREEHQSTSDLH